MSTIGFGLGVTIGTTYEYINKEYMTYFFVTCQQLGFFDI